MILSPAVRMTDQIRTREDQVINAVREGKECPFLYCITLPSNKQNLMDIHPYRELRRRKEYDTPFVILGLAESRKKAIRMVADMAEEIAVSIENPADFKKAFLEYRDSFTKES